MKKMCGYLIILIILLFLIPLSAEKVAVLDEINKPENMIMGNGYIYILEGVTVHIYDLNTYAYKGKFGKDGEGPGEIKKNAFGGPIIVVPYQDQVTISSAGKYSIFSKDGKYLKEIKINPFDNFYPFVEDTFVCFSTYAKGAGELYLAIYLADKDFKKSKEPIMVSDMMVGQNFQFKLPFTSFAPIPYQDKIYVAPHPEEFTIDAYDKTGKKVKSITREFKEKRVTSEYKKESMKWFKNDPGWKNIYGMLKERISFRNTYPPIMGILVDSDRIFVFTFHFDDNGDRECIIMDLEGNVQKTTYLPIKEAYGMDFTFPYNIYEGSFYILIEDMEEETWELHKKKL